MKILTSDAPGADGIFDALEAMGQPYQVGART